MAHESPKRQDLELGDQHGSVDVELDGEDDSDSSILMYTACGFLVAIIVVISFMSLFSGTAPAKEPEAPQGPSDEANNKDSAADGDTSSPKAAAATADGPPDGPVGREPGDASGGNTAATGETDDISPVIAGEEASPEQGDGGAASPAKDTPSGSKPS